MAKTPQPPAPPVKAVRKATVRRVEKAPAPTAVTPVPIAPAPTQTAVKAPPPVASKAPRPPLNPNAASPSGMREREALRLFTLAADLHRQGRLDDAIKGYARALALDPRMADAYNNLGVALRSQKKFGAAVAAYRRSLTYRPDNPGVYSNLGNALRDANRMEESVAAHRRAVELADGSVEAVYNLALAQRDAGDLAAAMRGFEDVLRRQPDHVDCHWDRALGFLVTGDLKRGFEEYEWRWKLDRSPPRQFPQPAWDGSALKGRSLLVHQEQGFGDMIQFVRYLPILKRSHPDSTVILECQPELARLFSGVPGADRVVVQGGSLPPFDVHIPLLSLARVFSTSLETVPASIPYLRAPEMHSVHLPAPPDQLKVGLAWAGKPSHRNDRNRSVSFERFLPLLEVADVFFFSLQKGESAADLDRLCTEALIMDIGPRMQDFADTAAALQQLDLLIGVDTSVVHLAGALGRPAWVLLPYSPDWRWLLDRADNPWYPSLRLFRQNHPGQWDDVFLKVRDALAEVARSRRRAGAAR
ncbi:MAG: tetratricopeptide repeat protein [Magnetospirillum sp. WYHS-4]